jgi:uncharacterized surface protein with fasciclin (FAS1) repeats
MAADEQSFALTELIDELVEDGSSGLHQYSATLASQWPAAGPYLDQLQGERIASAFWRCAQESGFTAFCDALTFCGLRDELPRLMDSGITVLAPTDEAFSRISESTRRDPRLVRQLLLGHLCSGVASVSDIRAKNCAVALAGQTHAAGAEGGALFVGTARLCRTDVRFDSGILHEVSSVLLVVSLVRDSHSEQVWKKSLQPSPVLAIVGGTGEPSEFEVRRRALFVAARTRLTSWHGEPAEFECEVGRFSAAIWRD